MLPFHALADVRRSDLTPDFDHRVLVGQEVGKLGTVCDRFSVEASATGGKAEVVLQGSLSGKNWTELTRFVVEPRSEKPSDKEGEPAEISNGPVFTDVKSAVLVAFVRVVVLRLETHDTRVSAWVGTQASPEPGVLQNW